MVKEVKILTNIIMLNKHHELGYKTAKGVMVIEMEDDKKYLLDLDSETDISSSDYIEILATKSTKEKILFKNIIFNTELLNKLAGND